MKKNRCDTRNSYQCVEPTTCTHDDECTEAGLGACSYAQGRCVECISDTHCRINLSAELVNNRANTSGLGACDVGRERCVQCVSNAHCPSPTTICDVRTNFCVPASAFTVSASLFLSLAVLAMTYF